MGVGTIVPSRLTGGLVGAADVAYKTRNSGRSTKC
jgi:hypothetical protein